MENVITFVFTDIQLRMAILPSMLLRSLQLSLTFYKIHVKAHNLLTRLYHSSLILSDTSCRSQISAVHGLERVWLTGNQPKDDDRFHPGEDAMNSWAKGLVTLREASTCVTVAGAKWLSSVSHRWQRKALLKAKL
jgi:hypothetical protein